MDDATRKVIEVKSQVALLERLHKDNMLGVN